jgi:hypothetical protein
MRLTRLSLDPIMNYQILPTNEGLQKAVGRFGATLHSRWGLRRATREINGLLMGFKTGVKP